MSSLSDTGLAARGEELGQALKAAFEDNTRPTPKNEIAAKQSEGLQKMLGIILHWPNTEIEINGLPFSGEVPEHSLDISVIISVYDVKSAKYNFKIPQNDYPTTAAVGYEDDISSGSMGPVDFSTDAGIMEVLEQISSDLKTKLERSASQRNSADFYLDALEKRDP